MTDPYAYAAVVVTSTDPETLAQVAARLRQILISAPEVDEINSGLAELSAEAWNRLAAKLLQDLQSDGIAVIDKAMQR